ncbi:MAG: hypothetical protein ACFFDG_02455 [Promethearchaeota archaeon]
MISHLPCKKCGTSLPFVKGSIAQCPYCEAKTFYMESVYSFKYYLEKILNVTSVKNERKIKFAELERRKNSIRSYFRELNSNFKEYRHLIVTKLDTIEIDHSKLFNLIRCSGNFEIIIDKFLLIHINNAKTKNEFQKYKDLSYIINKSLLGLYYSYLAKISLDTEYCAKYYKLAEKNYQNIIDFFNVTKLESDSLENNEKKEIYVILTTFVKILRGILNKNPKHFSNDLDSLLDRLNKIKEKDIVIYNLYSQIEMIYQLERKTSVLLEKVKVNSPFSLIDPPEVDIVLNTEENLEKLNNLKNWINDISEKYQKYQRNLLKLHSGKLIKYLESYRAEFIDNKNKNVEKLNLLFKNMITNAFNTYNSESIESLNNLGDFIQNDIFNEKIIERFEIEHKDLIELDESLKKFINEIFKKPIIRNLESEYYKKVLSFISNKHSKFDKFILKYINKMLQEFQDFRTKNILSLEEQRNQFSLDFKPNLQRLFDLSFNLDKDTLQYPLFIDIKVENKKLKVNQSETIKVIIENPNLSDIKDIKIYFFMPKTIQSKLKYTVIKKLKANKSRVVKTKITPIKTGTFLYMVMVEYQHINKTFWMPSMKFELEVEQEEELFPYQYFPIKTYGIFYSEFDLSRIYNHIRVLV